MYDLPHHLNSQEIKEARILLGVNEKSTIEEIKNSFRTKARQYHPDTSKSETDGEQFSKIRDAYKTLQKTNSQLDFEGLEDLFRMMNNPRNMISFFNKIIENSKPKKIESVVSLLQEEQYKKARRTYETTTEQAKKEATLIKETIQNNFKKKNIFHKPNLEELLGEMKFYANKKLFNYQKSLEEVQGLVLSHLSDIIKEEKYSLRMDYKYFENQLQTKFNLIDSIPLDTQYIEDEFEKYIIKKTMKEINPYDLNKTRDTIKKLLILDEYYGLEDNSHNIIKESYEQFLNPFRGKIVNSGVKSGIRKVLSLYHLEGELPEAGKLYRILGLTNRV